MAKEKKLSRRILKLRASVLKIRRKIFKNVWFVRGVIFSSILVLFFILVFGLIKLIQNTRVHYYLDLFRAFAFSSTSDFRSTGTRVNFLILGKGGAGHEAPDLTDTMIFVSLKLKDKEQKPGIYLISLPRDIWIEPLRAKLNSVYYWGNKKEVGGGLVLSKAVVEEVTGEPVHYALVVDLSLFKEVIDSLGGIDVYVEEPFVDEWYPIAGRENDNCNGDPLFKCRYETVRFEKGWQKMDGETALKFVRSRKAQGDEGNDLARAKRQQLVIKAIINSLQKREFWSSFDKVKNIANLVFKYVETDIDTRTMVALSRQFLAARSNIKNEVLPKDLFIVPLKSSKYDNLYVFVPKEGSFDEVHKWVDNFLSN